MIKKKLKYINKIIYDSNNYCSNCYILEAKEIILYAELF